VADRGSRVNLSMKLPRLPRIWTRSCSASCIPGVLIVSCSGSFPPDGAVSDVALFARRSYWCIIETMRAAGFARYDEKERRRWE
jgi:hypothetical protein